MNMRTDDTVYYDYLRKQFSSPERNNLVAKLMDSLAMTDDINVINYLFDHFTVPFNNKTLPTKTGLINLDPNSKYNPLDLDATDHYTGLTGAYLTWSYLGSPFTGAVNMTALAQNIYKYSWQETFEMIHKAAA